MMRLFWWLIAAILTALWGITIMIAGWLFAAIVWLVVAIARMIFAIVSIITVALVTSAYAATTAAGQTIAVHVISPAASWSFSQLGRGFDSLYDALTRFVREHPRLAVAIAAMGIAGFVATAHYQQEKARAYSDSVEISVVGSDDTAPDSQSGTFGAYPLLQKSTGKSVRQNGERVLVDAEGRILDPPGWIRLFFG